MELLLAKRSSALQSRVSASPKFETALDWERNLVQTVLSLGSETPSYEKSASHFCTFSNTVLAEIIFFLAGDLASVVDSDPRVSYIGTILFHSTRFAYPPRFACFSRLRWFSPPLDWSFSRL